MKNDVCIFVLVLLLTLSIIVSSPIKVSAEPDSTVHDAVFQKGMSYRHYPYPYDSAESNESLTRMATIGVEYVALTVWWKQENVDSTEIYSEPGWTATDEELKCAVDKIHELGMKVMLKPMVDPEDYKNHWRGEFPGYPEWFDSYRENITNHYAEFAEANNVELFCIGCEFQRTVSKTLEWERVIREVEERYSGPITYAAILDIYQSIEWWDSLDYVGIDAYFPLTNKYDPTLEELKEAWNQIAHDLESWQSTVNKPIIFTEIGYRSGNGTNIVPWDWWTNMTIDLQEQVDCYEAAFQVLWNKPWFYGLYWWIWESDPERGGLDCTDYTPQNKPVQEVIGYWYLPVHNIDTRLGYATIQEAIDASETLNGHTIRVDAGIYYENLNVTKSLTLQGENRNTTIIDGNGTGIVVDVSADNVSINGFSIRNSGFDRLDCGVRIYDSSGNNISHNVIESNCYGMLLENSNDSIFTSNNISSNLYHGIFLRYSNNNNFSSDNISFNMNGIEGFFGGNNTLSDNSVFSNKHHGVELTFSDYNILIDNNVSNNGHGIFIYASDHNFLSGNNVSSNIEDGIALCSSSKNTLIGNTMSNNFPNFGVWHALEFYELDQYVDTSNTVDGKPIYYFIGVSNAVYDAQTNAGTIYLINSNNITIKDLTLTTNWAGVCFWNTRNSKIENVTASYNKIGIGFYHSSNNIVTGSNISSNRYFGMHLDNSNNNMFFHNNFINNKRQVCSAPPCATTSINAWNNDFEGNYWGDYNGTDLDKDGIGNTSYAIDENNTDQYPLMGIFSSFNTSLGYHVNVISNSTIEDFEYFESNSTIKMIVSNMTTSQTFGFCRVCIPYALMDDPNNVRIVIDKGQTEVLFANSTLYDNSTHRWIYFAYKHSTHEVVIQSDTTPPTISILSPENKTYSVNDVSLTYTVSESTSWIGYSLDGQTNVTTAGNLTLYGLPDGTHSIIVYANDTAGNTGASETIYFTIETPKPEPFPTWIVAAIVILAGGGAALLVYFAKVKKTTGKVK